MGSRRLVPRVGVVVALACALLWLAASSASRQPLRAETERIEPTEPAAAVTLADRTSAPSALGREGAQQYTDDGLPIRPADPDAKLADGPMHPHPITPEHERIYRENNLVGALDRAVDLRDSARIRELVATYRAEYPQDPHVLQEGYEIIADCLEHLDAATRAHAQEFWDTQIRSQTRRYVRRYCLESF